MVAKVFLSKIRFYYSRNFPRTPLNLIIVEQIASSMVDDGSMGICFRIRKRSTEKEEARQNFQQIGSKLKNGNG